jgi:hypothetical protein
MDDETTGKLPDDTELTAVRPPAADDATRVMPPADEGATQVLSGESADATQVMPAAAGAASPPPPSPPQPTLMMSRPKSSGDGVPWWAWLLVILVIAAAAAAIWFFYLRSPGTSTAGDAFVGNWAPPSGGGGLVIAKTANDKFKVTEYDGQLQQVGSTTADLVGSELQLTVQAAALGLTDVTGTVQGTLTHDGSTDQLTLQFSSGGLTIKPIVYDRVDVLLPASPTPSPTPTPLASPSPSPSPSPSGSPSPSASASPSTDQQVIDGIGKLQVGIVSWANAHNNLYPAPQDVVEGGGIAQYVDPWPTDPFTNKAMAPGTAPGSYVYEQLSGGQMYRLTGYLSNGLTYSVP